VPGVEEEGLTHPGTPPAPRERMSLVQPRRPVPPPSERTLADLRARHAAEVEALIVAALEAEDGVVLRAAGRLGIAEGSLRELLSPRALAALAALREQRRARKSATRGGGAAPAPSKRRRTA